ncbi:MAG: carbohydrate ABC transporter permease, partial [Clostridia bacterium]
YLSVIVRESTMMDATKLANMTDEQLKLMQNIGEKPLRSAQIFLGALPILLVYPFMQRFFVKGIAVGSVKG